MLAHLRPAVVSMALFTLILGVAYPFAMTGLAGVAFPAQAEGSLIRRDGVVVGSSLIAQGFTGAQYLHPRPSAAGDGYNAAGSSGSNLGPLNADLATRVAETATELRAESDAPIPGDAVTTSASGLDPHVSPENALRQAQRIATARGLTLEAVTAIIDDHTEGALLGFIGQPRVNVLETNLALDASAAAGRPPAA